MAVDVRSLADVWTIGDVEIPGRVVLAPMAGVSVQAFRRQGRRHGAGLVCSEMVSACGLGHGNERTKDYLRIAPDERPLAVQIFGSDPDQMAEAARMGFTRAIVPANSPTDTSGIQVVRVGTVTEALVAAGLSPRAAATAGSSERASATTS